MRFPTVLLILAFLAVSGCEYYARPEDVDCSSVYFNDSVQRDLCFYNKSVASYNALMCRENINDAELRADCIDEVAMGLKDFYPCRQHDRPSKRDACEAKVGEVRRGERR